jgi:hypothetical protein
MTISAFTDIANCACIVDGEHAYTDAGSTHAVNDGDVIQQLTDQTGNGNHWTNTGTSSTRPTLLNDTLLGQRVVECTAANLQLLNLPANFFSGYTQHTIIWVMRAKADPGVASASSRHHNFNSSGFSAYVWTDGTVYDDTGAPASTVLNYGGLGGTAWHLHHSSGKVNDFAVGGARCRYKARLLSGAYGNFNASPQFGKGTAAEYFNGYMRLCVIYSRYITDTEFDDACAFAEDNYMNPTGINRLIKGCDTKYIIGTTLEGGGGDLGQVIKPIGDAATGVGFTSGRPIYS